MIFSPKPGYPARSGREIVPSGDVEKILISFIKWNGWGPPDSEYLILEYCQGNCVNEANSNHAHRILLGWMNGKYSGFKIPI